MQAQFFPGHDLSGLLKECGEHLINFALQLNPQTVLKELFFFNVQMKRAKINATRGIKCDAT